MAQKFFLVLIGLRLRDEKYKVVESARAMANRPGGGGVILPSESVELNVELVE